MNTVKKILENYDIVTEKSDKNTKNLAALVNAGLLEESKLPILNRALSKSASMMTEAEKKALQGFVDSLASCVISEQQDYLSKMDTKRPMSYPSEKDIPTDLILKRKAIRVYPDNQKVALYYCQALDKYISVPYGKNAKSLGMALNEDVQQQKPRDFQKILQIYARRQRKSPKELSATVIGKLAKRSGQSESDALSTARKAMGAKDRPEEGFQTGYRAGVDFFTRQGMKSTADREVPKRPSKYESNKKSTSSVPEVQEPIKTQFGKLPIKESFRKKLEEKRLQKEDLKSFTYDDLEDQDLSTRKGWESLGKDFIPGVAALRSAERTRRAYQQGDVVGTALHGAMTAVDVTGAGSLAKLAAKGIYHGGKAALKLASKGLTKKATATTAAKGAETTAAKEAEKATATTAAKGVEKAAEKASPGKWRRRIGSLGKLAAAAAGAAANAVTDSANKSEDNYTKELPHNYQFGLQAKTSGASRVTPDIASARRSQIDFGADPYSNKRQNESNNLNIMKQMVEKNIQSHVIHINETPITINNRVAKKVVNVYESLNRQNKKQIEKMLNEDANSFKKVINFAVRQ